MKMSVTTVFPVLLTFENCKSGNTVNYNLPKNAKKNNFIFGNLTLYKCTQHVQINIIKDVKFVMADPVPL